MSLYEMFHVFVTLFKHARVFRGLHPVAKCLFKFNNKDIGTMSLDWYLPSGKIFSRTLCWGSHSNIHQVCHHKYNRCITQTMEFRFCSPPAKSLLTTVVWRLSTDLLEIILLFSNPAHSCIYFLFYFVWIPLVFSLQASNN